tara:strand:- start:65 stop:385 length:321 start_codon:yes stop_codon:yes gene_type:complete
MEPELKKRISKEIDKFSFLNFITFFISIYCFILLKDMNSFIKESYNSIEINDNVLKSEIEEIYNNLKNKSDINFKSIEKLNRFAELNHSDIKKLQSQIMSGSKRFD